MHNPVWEIFQMLYILQYPCCFLPTQTQPAVVAKAVICKGQLLILLARAFFHWKVQISAPVKLSAPSLLIAPILQTFLGSLGDPSGLVRHTAPPVFTVYLTCSCTHQDQEHNVAAAALSVICSGLLLVYEKNTFNDLWQSCFSMNNTEQSTPLFLKLINLIYQNKQSFYMDNISGFLIR